MTIRDLRSTPALRPSQTGQGGSYAASNAGASAMSTTLQSTVSAPPALVIQVDGKTVPMTVSALAIEVAIAGRLARTAMQLTFFNPHERDLEGELTFPLPEGAALSGYALDIEGELVDASLVEKERARVVFEAEVRKNVDPGLIERIEGNQFRTRIWPLPAKGTRTIKVTYVSALTRQDGSAVYELPLKFEPPKRDASADQRARFGAWEALFAGEAPPVPAARRGLLSALLGKAPAGPVEPFRLSVSVAKGHGSPSLLGAEALGFREEAQAWVCELSNPAGIPDRVRVALPCGGQDAVAIERQADGDHHFQLDAFVADDAPPALLEPARVALIWDGSLSRATQDKAREFELLAALLARWGTQEVDLFVLREGLDAPRSFSLVGGASEDLLQALAELPYDGATRIGALALAGDYEACLLFSDGLSTLGDELPTLCDAPTYVISSGATVNAPLLRHLAERGGGAWIDLERVHPAEAAAQIGVEGLSLLGADFDPAAVTDLLPAGRRVVEDGGISLSGRLLAEEATITLRFGRGTRETVQRSFTLRRADAGTTGLVGRLWAQGQVDELALRGERYAASILELGRRFHIVTPNTSLLVLETLAQHLEHKIVPAATRTKMRKAYEQQAAKADQDEARRREQKLDRVHGWWKDLVAWWEKDYERNPSSLPGESKKSAAGLPGASLGGGMAMSMDMASAEMREDCAAPEPELLMRSAPAPARSAGATRSRRASASRDAAPAPRAKRAEPEDEGGATAAGISVKAWDPQTPYLAAMKSAGEEGAYAAYLGQRAEHGRSPSFYLDCASYLFRIGQRELGLRVLSNVAELELENPQLLRIVGYKLETEGFLSEAAEVLDRVRAMRGEEPQSYRDLALVLDQQGEYRRAAELLWKVVTGAWDDRFPEIETIALTELNNVLAKAERAGQALDPRELGIEARFLKVLELDLRIALAWDADLTDVDLWVFEPCEEKCYYSHALTRMGGRMSRDFRQGYGPEVYTLRRGMKGVYRIEANYYGSSQQSLTGPATLLATVFTNYGRPEEQRQKLTLRVTEVRDVTEIGEVTLG